MEILRTSFLLLSIGGAWKPRGWRGVKAFLYYIYQYSIIFANHVFIISGVLDLQFKNIDTHVLIDNLTLLMAMVIGRQKIACFISKREDIKSIIDSFKKAPFKPISSEEEVIARRFDGIANIFVSYTGTILCAATLFSGSREGVMDPPYHLPYSGWFPYNYTNPKIYWATAGLQMYGIYSTAAVDLAFDPLMSAVFCHLCAQIHILKHRFGVMVTKLEDVSRLKDNMAAQECQLTAEWVEYHIDVITLIKFMNKIFSSIIFVQYTVSSVILCTLAFLMSHTKGLSMEFVGYSGFLTTKCFQVFLPCFCADMLTYELLNITSGIYGSNWFNLSNSLRKSVVIIMSKCHKPILITSSFFIVLNLESFTKIIKLAYTIYNVLP
ncbi:odorant receptor 94a-like isoform X2 [Cotesia glomerata]|uniref:odorant receptor 94a-like isoform X2 n=1 Tax=Cotesia glomerata TaxID=32391 RepID=UPI001D00583F|nr:odorant receptor 94a-like isoform X2 [Cotesia glomerata]